MSEQRKRALMQITALAEAFDKELSPGAIVLYADALEDLDGEALKTACAKAVRELRFFPRAAEIRALAGVRPPPSQTQIAENAWGEVLLCLQRRAGWGMLDADTLRSLRAIGGSSMVRVSDERGGLNAIKARFIDAYLSGASAPAKALGPGELTKLFGKGSAN